MHQRNVQPAPIRADGIVTLCPLTHWLTHFLALEQTAHSFCLPRSHQTAFQKLFITIARIDGALCVLRWPTGSNISRDKTDTIGQIQQCKNQDQARQTSLSQEPEGCQDK